MSFIIYCTQSVGFIKKLIRTATGKIPTGEFPSQANYEISKPMVTTIKWRYSILAVGDILKGRFETPAWNEQAAEFHLKKKKLLLFCYLPDLSAPPCPFIKADFSFY